MKKAYICTIKVPKISVGPTSKLKYSSDIPLYWKKNVLIRALIIKLSLLFVIKFNVSHVVKNK